MADSNNSDSCMQPNYQHPPSKSIKGDGDSDLENRVPRLPYDVLFDYFSAKDRAIAAAVSKDWNKIASSYPVFHANYFSFEENYLSDGNVTMPIRKTVKQWTRKFMKIMDESLVKFSEEYATGLCNGLVVTMRDTFNMHGGNSVYLDRWINLVVDKNFTDLHLNLCSVGFPLHQRYEPPKAILNARSLVALSLCSCKLPNIWDEEVIFLDSLQQLKLENCFCDQRSIGNLISACHSLRELNITECSGVTELNLHLCKLKGLIVRDNVQQRESIRKIIVRATCLVSFCYFSTTFVNKPCQINLERCEKLESLCLECLVFPQGFLPNICQNFPLLRSLILSPAQGFKRFIVSSEKLESLSFVHVIGRYKFETLGYVIIRNVGSQYIKKDLAEVVIRTPNLKFFNYAGRSLEQLSAYSKFSPYAWIKKVKLYGSESREMDTRWFLSLGDAISQLGPNLKLSLHVDPMDRWSFNIEELGTACFRRLANVEHMKLKALLTNKDLCLLTDPSLMDGLLWSCHPKTLSLSVPLNSDIERLRQDLLNQLMEQRTCDSGILRCWPHDLKDVMVEYAEPKCKKEVKYPWRRRIKLSFTWY